MTHNFQSSSLFNHCKLNNRRRVLAANLYQVVVNTEDESYEYEVEADTFAEACSQAEDLADSLYLDITFIEIYHFE